VATPRALALAPGRRSQAGPSLTNHRPEILPGTGRATLPDRSAAGQNRIRRLFATSR